MFHGSRIPEWGVAGELTMFHGSRRPEWGVDVLTDRLEISNSFTALYRAKGKGDVRDNPNYQCRCTKALIVSDGLQGTEIKQNYNLFTIPNYTQNFR